jgi:Leucine-rich repeat (LRR) protein
MQKLYGNSERQNNTFTMKKTILISILSSIAVLCSKAQNVNIPDPVFKDFLVNHTWLNNPNNPSGGTWIRLDANNDGEIQVNEAATYQGGYFNHGFLINNLPITDLTGIEAFTTIDYLSISFCPITTLNVNGCTSLKYFNCYNAMVSTFSMSIAVMEEFNLYGCPNLTSVDVYGFALQELNLSSNPLLTAIDLAIHPALTLFRCQNNESLDSLDVSSCAALETLYATGNQLKFLNLANGNMQSFQRITANGHPNLTCIQVDNISVANYLWEGGYPYEFDPWASFNTSCVPPGPCVVSIPDANFKNALLENSSINTNGNNEIECTEAIAYSGAILVDNLQISNITGIEAFENITSFSGNNNMIDSLNLSNFVNLVSVNCTANTTLEYLNASGCSALTLFNVSSGLFTGVDVNLSGCNAISELNLRNKNLNGLNVSGCLTLTNLDCSKNKINLLNITGCMLLDSLDCSENELTTLDVSNNTSLTMLNCSDNQLTGLNTFNNNNLITLNCSHNQLTYLFAALNTSIKDLNCSNNAITYLDFNNNTNLLILNCSHNNLNSISVNNNPFLSIFDCSYNNLSILNVNIDTALINLNCNYNQLVSIDVSNNPAVQTLRCDYNNLPNINVSSNLALQTLSCSGNSISLIDVSNNLNLKELLCSHNEISNMDLNLNTELLNLDCSYNQFDNLDLQENTSLLFLYCTKNELSNLDLSNMHMFILACDSNNLQTLNLANGYNSTALQISANNNPELSCIKVDDVFFSTTQWTGGSFIFDSGVIFSEDCDIPLETRHLGSKKNLDVFPNPTNGVVYFSNQTNLQLTNAIGERLLDKKNISSIDISNQAAGIYFYTCISDNGLILQHGKIVKE